MNKNHPSILHELTGDVERLTRHLTIIEALLREQPAGIIKISQMTGLPEHKVRYSLRVLERGGIITPSREGAILTPEFVSNREKVADELSRASEDISRELKKFRNALLGR